MLKRWTARGVVTLVSAAAALTLASVPSAEARVVKVDRRDGQLVLVHVYSPSMRKTIVNEVLNSGGGAQPVFYLLNGGTGGATGDKWRTFTSYRKFFAGKAVTVVSPVGGGFDYYADWRYPDLARGISKWQTYLMRELPAALASVFPFNGRAAIAGVSQSGAPALDIAGRSPMYRAAASYSGCPASTSIFGFTSIWAFTLAGGGNPINMRGLSHDPAWYRHDPARNPVRLRGKSVYLGTSTGMPGEVDKATPLPALLIGPAQVEAVTHVCTGIMRDSLNRAGVPNTYRVFRHGAHTWKLFERQMMDSWPQIGRAIGA
ncbi:MAG: alpha/beta hydrolase family protein [Gordonia sp. (in: high G+C Gram-positive bacteria)]|uniref:alpha/beta hydrolase n=1 Tax=Gordonia sp. (in: high G+C Gram-positive bacteria) TaxID=84139 RepID=UPI0039E66D80